MDSGTIKELFERMLEETNYMLDNDFYNEKYSLSQIKEKLETWYLAFKEKHTLKTISIEDLEFLDFEITEIFDIYFKDESLDDNYTERLLYDFSVMKRYWKDEMLGGM